MAIILVEKDRDATADPVVFICAGPDGMVYGLGASSLLYTWVPWRAVWVTRVPTEDGT